MSFGIDLAERGWLPDWMIRQGIRQLLRQRVQIETARSIEEQQTRFRAFIAELKRSPIAIETAAANEQHYELPPAYFDAVLGPNRKYSCCLYEPGCKSLQEAEAAMLDVTCERAGLKDGQCVLELGCGWGSLSLWMAAKYPNSRITAVSNSQPQRQFIEQRANERQIRNLQVITSDMNEFVPPGNEPFDRVVSVEMLEHMRNYERLFDRIASWLAPGGQMFAHVFCHREVAYPFEVDGENDWMARHFFTGGIMPSALLFSQFPKHLRVVDQWHVSGVHYSKTLEAWLQRHDRSAKSIRQLFSNTYPAELAETMFHRWRIFYLACSELFAFNGGREWFVTHVLMQRN